MQPDSHTVYNIESIPPDTAKVKLRSEVIAIRDAMTPYERKMKDCLILKNLLAIQQFRDAEVILMFASFGSEPDTDTIFHESLKIGKKIAMPKVIKNERRLDIYRVLHLNELSKGHMGIPEPEPSSDRMIDPNTIDLIVVPGVAFDPTGGRVGYGGGYYDRFLVRLAIRPVLIAIAYDEQVLKHVPMMDHDIKMDIVVTDKQVYESVKIP